MAKPRDIPGFGPDLPFRESAARAVEVRTEELFSFSEGVLDTEDIERVHDMRVASRRLRAALEIFAPAFPKKPHRSVLREVKQLADVLGERRDPDVQIAALRRAEAELPREDAPGIESFVEALRGGQAHANGLLAEQLERIESDQLKSRLMSLAVEARGMKARKVKGIDINGPLRGEARKIVMVRLEELYSFAPAIFDPAEVQALHDMRIAAKRLRYVLETTEPAFGPAAKRGAKAARRLQDVLGEIHDCDEMLPRIRRHVEKLQAEDAAAVRESAGPDAPDLKPGAAKEAPNRTAYRGLAALAAYSAARRDVLYGRFLREWRQLDEQEFRQELEKGLVPRRRVPANGRPHADGGERRARARAKAGAA